MLKPISKLPMLSDDEYDLIVRMFNDTQADYPKDKCVHELFEEQATKTPDKVAVIACDKTLTYSELNKQANRIAHSLIEKGIKSNDIVAFMLPRKSYLLSVMFGILKSGAAYMPIDPDYPQERIEYMLSDSGAKICITEDNVGEYLINDNIENPNVGMNSDCYYCALHTSGSTGKPKMSLLMHKNLINFTTGNTQFYENVEISISATIVTFDAFMLDTVIPLCKGIKVKLLSNDQIYNQAFFEKAFEEAENVMFFSTPTKLNNYIRESQYNFLKHIKSLIVGGEKFPEELYLLIRRYSESTNLFNIYGPTEDTICVTYDKIEQVAPKEKTIADMYILSKEDHNRVVKEFNNTKVDYPKDKCVHTLFEEQVLKTPDKVAVIACDNTLTYSELNKQANRIAHSLIEKGIKSNDIVAFMLPRKSYLLSVMFGILKSGAAYMPIDPDYPQERIEYMLSDSGAKICITEDNIGEFLNSDNTENPNVGMNSEDLCYCIYTSGSTGKPKGTAIRHKNLVNFCNNNNYQSYAIREGTCALSLFKSCFDAFEFDAIMFMVNGKSIVLVSDEDLTNYDRIAELMDRYNTDVIHCTPTMLGMMLLNQNFTKSLNQVKVCMCGAEVFPKELFTTLRKYTNAKIINGYGPSETTIGVSFGEIEDDYKYKSLSVSDLKIQSKKQNKIIAEAFNNTAFYYPDKNVHTLFEEQVLKSPGKEAVIACDKTLTYRELNEQANRIAHGLIDKGIKPNDIVAFMLPRKSYLLSVMFGILKSGAAYMPIDPDYPKDRIDYMLSDSGAKFCITEDNIEEYLSNDNTENPNVKMNSGDLCYCIYTSGSTGKPKGTLLNHKNVVNYCSNNNNNNVVHSIIKESYKNIVSVTTVGFDIFVTESILPLLNGLSIILADEKQAKIQKELNDLLWKQPVDVLQTTPTKMKSLIADDTQLEYLKRLKAIILGGEALDIALVNELKKHTQADIFNIYGPTETTVWSTNAKIV